MAGALVDRLTRHVRIQEMNGDSYRLKQSKIRRRKSPAPVDVDIKTEPLGVRRNARRTPA